MLNLRALKSLGDGGNALNDVAALSDELAPLAQDAYLLVGSCKLQSIHIRVQDADPSTLCSP